MSATALRELIERTGVDGHEFATAYVSHVETARARGTEPLTVTAAVQSYIKHSTI